MDQSELKALLNQLIADWENEVVEFKQVDDAYSTSKIGEYFSAIANEANLQNIEKGWLIFGVDNHSRSIKGSNYRENKERLYSLKHQISQGSEPSITFRDIHEYHASEGRVLLFEIPAAPIGMPIAWNGHYYARAGESLTHLGLDKLDRIRKQVGSSDWTAKVVEGASINNLDVDALKKAREGFAKNMLIVFKLMR